MTSGSTISILAKLGSIPFKEEHDYMADPWSHYI